MGQTVKLRTSKGGRVHIVLENWGSELDHLRRRWVRTDGYWECMDTGMRAEESRSGGTKISSDPNRKAAHLKAVLITGWTGPGAHSTPARERSRSRTTPGDRVDGEVPSGIPGVLPLVGHRDGPNACV